LDLLELGKRAQAGWSLLTGATAGSGEQRENRGDKCGKNAGHGSDAERFYREVVNSGGLGRSNRRALIFLRKFGQQDNVIWMG
jgi:hypothetical protein